MNKAETDPPATKWTPSEHLLSLFFINENLQASENQRNFNLKL